MSNLDNTQEQINNRKNAVKNNIAKAFEPELEKGNKTGEGSRGGKIIGHTKSGKPVYENKEANDYRELSKQGQLGTMTSNGTVYNRTYHLDDHADACKIQREHAEKLHDKANEADSHRKADSQHKKANKHYDYANSHRDYVNDVIEHDYRYLGKGGIAAMKYEAMHPHEYNDLPHPKDSGDLIGHTSTHKRIFEKLSPEHEHYTDFTPKEHVEAYNEHIKYSAENPEKRGYTYYGDDRNKFNGHLLKGDPEYHSEERKKGRDFSEAYANHVRENN